MKRLRTASHMLWVQFALRWLIARTPGLSLSKVLHRLQRCKHSKLAQANGQQADAPLLCLAETLICWGITILFGYLQCLEESLHIILFFKGNLNLSSKHMTGYASPIKGKCCLSHKKINDLSFRCRFILKETREHFLSCLLAAARSPNFHQRIHNLDILYLSV